MSSRIKRIAQEVASDALDTSAHPRLAGLAALRGDFAALQRELVEEAAYSMGNSARRLEAGLELLKRLDNQLARLGAQDPARRSELVKRFNAQREEVLLRLHYVRIQREALGFVRHTELDARYPVPPKKA